MKEEVRLERVGEVLHAHVPNTSLFNERAKRIGGRFDGESRCWKFRAIDRPSVEAVIADLYGPDALERGEPRTCTVRVKVGPGGLDASRSAVEFCGRSIARRLSRDTAVKGPYPSDGPPWQPSAGSAKYPAVADDDEVRVLELRDFPAALLAHASYAERAAVVGEVSLRDALAAEVARLEALLEAARTRLEEYDAANTPSRQEKSRAGR